MSVGEGGTGPETANMTPHDDHLRCNIDLNRSKTHEASLTRDLLMWVSLLLALLSANSRLLMSFRRALYLLICSLMISSTHLQMKENNEDLIHSDRNRDQSGAVEETGDK